jgi:hypothetical protein
MMLVRVIVPWALWLIVGGCGVSECTYISHVTARLYIYGLVCVYLSFAFEILSKLALSGTFPRHGDPNEHTYIPLTFDLCPFEQQHQQQQHKQQQSMVLYYQ